MEKPLAGLKVLELARILAGPWVGQLLADLGADVVKVERPGAGDDTRGWGPPFIEGADGGDLSAAYFHSCNRGKRSIAVDFETPEGQALVRDLARHADVRDRELQGRRPEEIRPRLREPEGRQSASGLLLDHRLRPGRALCDPRRLRLHDPGHGRHHGSDRRSRGRAAEDRRRLRRHLHRRVFGRRRARGAAPARRDGRRARISTWRCSTSRRACWPTRR